MNDEVLQVRFAGTTPEFQAAIKRIAESCGKGTLDVYLLWRDYSERCLMSDQPELLGEFKEWYANHQRRNPLTMKYGERVTIPVSQLEFVVGGNTIWIHSPQGATVLRIQTPRGKAISVNQECQNTVSHADIQATDEILICLKTEPPLETAS